MKIKIGKDIFFIHDIKHVTPVRESKYPTTFKYFFTISFFIDKEPITITDQMVEKSILEDIRTKLQKEFEEYYEKEMVLL